MSYVQMTKADVARIYRAKQMVNQLKFRIHCAIRARDRRTAALCISRLNRLKQEIYEQYEVILT